MAFRCGVLWFRNTLAKPSFPPSATLHVLGWLVMALLGFGSGHVLLGREPREDFRTRPRYMRANRWITQLNLAFMVIKNSQNEKILHKITFNTLTMSFFLPTDALICSISSILV